jgi:hypothetical protein
VLVEGRGKGDAFTGRTERNEIAHFTCEGDPTGKLVDVEIVRAFKNSLEARMDGEPAQRPQREPQNASPERPRSLPVV